jgi:hypothetical protein
VLATSLKFTDGAVLSRFRIVAHQGCGRKKLLFQSEDGGFYRLRNLKDLEYTIEPARPVPAQVSRTSLSLF